MNSPLRGIIPPLITPLLSRDELDIAGLERVIEHVLAGGVSGLFILGTTGEGPSLSYRLRRELIERTCKQVKKRVPVLVGITDTAFVESVRLASHSTDVGADAVVLAPPYYMPEGQPELREYLQHLLPELRLPLFLYNMPPLTKVAFELETVRWALDQPNIVGMKDSSGNLVYFNQVLHLMKARPSWTLLMGPEDLLMSSVLSGGHGCVPGGGNIFPRLFVDAYEAAAAGKLERARELQDSIAEVAERIYRVGKHPSAVIKGVKCAVSTLGLCGDFLAEPFHRFREPERQLIEKAMADFRARGL